MQHQTSFGTLAGARLSYTVSGARLVKGIDCVIEPGVPTALLGPNGAGKSTLLHLLAGVLHPSTGSVQLDGEDLSSLPSRTRAQRVAVVEQTVNSGQPLMAFDVVLLGRTPFQGLFASASADDFSIASAALETVGMGAFAGRLYETLSGGEQQRIQLARALAQQPRVLLLDEPTNHLDVGAQLGTMRLLRSLGSDGFTVVAALHDLNLAAEFCDHAILLDDGAVVAAGPTEEVLVPATIRKVFGIDVAVLENPLSGRPLIVFR